MSHLPQEFPGSQKAWSLDNIMVADLTTGASPITFYLNKTIDASNSSANLKSAVSLPKSLPSLVPSLKDFLCPQLFLTVCLRC